MPKKKANKQKQKAKRTNKSVHSAPAAVSDFLSQSIKFKPSKGGKGLIMEVCLPLCNIVGTTFTTGTQGTLTGPGGSSTDIYTVNPVYPIQGSSSSSVALADGATISSYINPAWSLIAAAFTRWKVRKLIFKYQPQSTSTQADQLVFAFAADPAHPVIGLGAPATVLTNSILLNMGDSIPFMPWKEWSLDVSQSLQKENELYIRENFIPTVVESTAAVTRFSQAGVFACTHSTSQATPINYGVLYGCAEFELLEFCPITTIQGGHLSSSAYLEMQRQNRILEENLMDLEKQIKRLEKDEDTASSSNCLNDMEVLPQDGSSRLTYQSQLEPRKLSVTRYDFKRQA